MAEAAGFKVPPQPSLEDAKALIVAATSAAAEDPMKIDASEVEVMTTSFLLTLLSVIESRTEAKPPAIIEGATDEFVAAFTDLGLFQEMMKMEFAT